MLEEKVSSTVIVAASISIANYYASAPIGRGIKRCFCLTSV